MCHTDKRTTAQVYGNVNERKLRGVTSGLSWGFGTKEGNMRNGPEVAHDTHKFFIYGGERGIRKCPFQHSF